MSSQLKSLITRFTYAVTSNSLIVFIFLGAIWLASSWALFRPGFFYLHDFVHAARAIEMLRALQEGQFPVRWSENFGYGFGMPLFQYYAPLPSYVGAFLLWLGVPTILMLKLLWGVCSAVSLWGSYSLGKRWFGRASGVVMAALFTLFPYRAVNLYVRGALSEAWGMMWMPWVVLFSLGIAKKQRWAWVGLVLSATGLMLSHNLSTLMFVPLAGLMGVTMCLFASESWLSRFKNSVSVFTGFLVAGGLSAFYMIPAVMEKQFTQVDSILSGYFSPTHHFLYIRQFIKPFWGYGGSEWGPNDGISFFWGYGQWLGLGVAMFGVCWCLLSWWKQKNNGKKSTLWVPLIMGSVLMAVGSYFSLARSQWLWDKVSVLSYIQFPWRWLSVVGVGITLVVGAGSAMISNRNMRLWMSALIVLSTISTAWYFFKPESPLLTPDDYYYTDAVRIRSTMSSILPDYMPVGLGKVTTPPESLFAVPYGLEKQVEVVVDNGHQKLFRTTFTSAATLGVAAAQYPGWYAEVDGQHAEFVPGNWPGTLAVDVPAGEHLIGIKLGETPVRWWSNFISFVSLCIVFGVAIRTSLTQELVVPVHTQQAVIEKPLKSTKTKKTKKKRS